LRSYKIHICKNRDEKAVVLSELEQRKHRWAADCRRRRSGALSRGITTTMCRSRLTILESLSALTMEGCQEALLADATMYIRDNRIPGMCCVYVRRKSFAVGVIDMQYTRFTRVREIWNRLVLRTLKLSG